MKYGLLLICLCYPTWLMAVDKLDILLGDIQGEGWQAKNVAAQLSFTKTKEFSLQFSIKTLKLSPLKQSLNQLKFNCRRTRYTFTKIACPAADLEMGDRVLDKKIRNVSFSYDFKTQRFDLTAKKIALASGQVDLTAHLSKGAWQAEIDLKKVSVEKLLAKVDKFVDVPKNVKINANTDLNVKVKQQQRLEATLSGKLRNLSYSLSDTQAGENLMAWVDVKINQRRNDWKIVGDTTIGSGEILSNPIYVNLSGYPVMMTVTMTLAKQLLEIEQLYFYHQRIAKIRGTGRFNLGKTVGIDSLSLNLSETSIQSLYNAYIAESFENIKLTGLTGTVAGNLSWRGDTYHVDTDFNRVSLANDQKTFGINNLSGKLQWHNHSDRILPTQLRWEGGYVVSQITLGAGQLKADLNADHIQLLHPFFISILDGAAHIDSFHLRNLGKKNVAWDLKGSLRPISLSAMSSAFDGPPLSGRISGVIPAISYKNQELKIGGALLIKAFDGDIVIHTLSLQAPFSRRPKLMADIDITKINLGVLTDVYKEFGKVQGHLSGYFKNLRLLNWQPISFDAYLGTPKDNTLPLTISQKAVENLSNLGSGGGAVNSLSQGILSFFEEFSYEKLGWGCRLRNRICYMRGAEATKGGYYIVKGGGIPRIDVIGYNQQVDWKILINRLKTIATADSPIIK